jgi:septal ring factor EnvC (AmiA/AmiB activator)
LLVEVTVMRCVSILALTLWLPACDGAKSSDIERLQTRIDAGAAQHDVLVGLVDGIRLSIQDYPVRLSALERELAAKEARIAELEARLSKLEGATKRAPPPSPATPASKAP